MALKQSEIIQGTEKEFLEAFQKLCYSRIQSMVGLGGTATTEKTVEKEHFYMFFDFEKEGQYGRKQDIRAWI